MKTRKTNWLMVIKYLKSAWYCVHSAPNSRDETFDQAIFNLITEAERILKEQQT